MLQGPSRAPRGGKPKQLVLLLHGWGADGANLIDLADEMADAVPDALFIAPNAPEICEVNPYGFQWFGLSDRRPSSLLAGVKRAGETLNGFIDAKLKELGLKDENLALIGFSQGTMTALHVALRRKQPSAAVVGFSGALIAPELLASDIASRPPVCLVHGQFDDVVPFAAMGQAETALRAAGVPMETHSRPGLGHSIDMAGIQIAKEFLKKHVSA